MEFPSASMSTTFSTTVRLEPGRRCNCSLEAFAPFACCARRATGVQVRLRVIWPPAPRGSGQILKLAQSARVSLVVAVTGHRDLVPEEIPRIRATVREFLLGLERDFLDLPLLVVTPVAEGADRLVAEVAAAEGIELLFVLPMPREIYR